MFRSVASRPPQHARHPFESPHHRIVHAHEDVAVMGQQTVGERREFLRRFLLSITIGSSLILPLVITRQSGFPRKEDDAAACKAA